MMLKLLLRKELMEVFKGYFYDQKRNRKRSTAGVIAMFLLFAVAMIAVLGGMFTYLSLTLCGGLTAAGMGWLYFALMSGISILLGAFGSIFNTFSRLYLSKDNDLLLSMPIPVKDIVASRLLNVYLLGAMYSAVVIIPAIIVYWIITGATAAKIICGIVLVLVISFIVLVLSCLLGWCVAKLSLKLKNRSFVTVFASVLFIAIYYFVYFRASAMIQELILNASVYGEKIKGSAYILYLFGRIGEGDYFATVIFIAASAIILGLTWLILKNSFLSIVTSTGAAEKKKYVEHAVACKSAFRTLLSKELERFKSNPNYMLNCGFGLLIIPICGVLMLIKGNVLFDTLDAIFTGIPGAEAVIVCAAFGMMCSMNDIATPSVSLEGKSIWILQSLPVDGKTVLRAKTAMHLILSAMPMLFATICAMLMMRTSVGIKLLCFALSMLFVVFSAVFSSFLGISMPNLSWTNEIIPIKQNVNVLLAILGCWVVVVVFVLAYLLFFAQAISTALYLGIWCVILAVISILLERWLDTKGACRFSELHV